MTDYTVTISQLWKQRVVVVGAASRRDALVLAREGRFTIHEDPEYAVDIDPLDWKVEEADDD